MMTKDIGAVLSTARGGNNAALTAGGAGDNTAVTGHIVDRFDHNTPQSAVLAIAYSATLGAGETLTVDYTVQHDSADDLGGATTFATATDAVIATGPTGGGTVTGVFEVNLNLQGAQRYIRVNVTPDLSRANTDTAQVSTLWVFGGAERLPA